MAVNPTRSIGETFVDHSGELGRFSIPIATSDDLATILASADWIAWAAALNAVINGTLINISRSEVKRESNAAFSATGQREEKWLLVYQDNVTIKTYSSELPCRDTSLATVAGTDMVDLTVSPWVAFKTAFETLWVSPDENAVTLLEVRLIGRNV